MDTESKIRIEFSKGYEIEVSVSQNEEEIKSQAFHKNTHQIEDILSFIEYYEAGGYDVECDC